MFGWREMAEKLAAVYWPPPAQHRARRVQAPPGVAPAISYCNNYYIFLGGDRGHDGSVIIIFATQNRRPGAVVRPPTNLLIGKGIGSNDPRRPTTRPTL
jgi:hypothetical protein